LETDDPLDKDDEEEAMFFLEPDLVRASLAPEAPWAPKELNLRTQAVNIL
jgi:hypothetical protein